MLGPAGTGTIGKRALLLTFVLAMTGRQSFDDPDIMRRLCDIVIQRFLSSVTVPSDDIRAVMQALWPGAGQQ